MDGPSLALNPGGKMGIVRVSIPVHKDATVFGWHAETPLLVEYVLIRVKVTS